MNGVCCPKLLVQALHLGGSAAGLWGGSRGGGPGQHYQDLRWKLTCPGQQAQGQGGQEEGENLWPGHGEAFADLPPAVAFSGMKTQLCGHSSVIQSARGTYCAPELGE